MGFFLIFVFKVLEEKNIHVGQLGDSELRQFLSDYSYLVGPVTSKFYSII